MKDSQYGRYTWILIRSVAQRMTIVAAIEQDVNMVIGSSIKPKLTMKEAGAFSSKIIYIHTH